MPLDNATRAALRQYAGSLEAIGFTGTTAGLTSVQSAALALVLTWLRAGGAREFHHGICIGADEDASLLASALRFECHGWPGRPDGDAGRSTVAVVDVLHDLYPTPPGITNNAARRAPELARNRMLARQHVLVACPRKDRMVLRSGTWATVRYALAWHEPRPVLLVLPDGWVGRARPVYRHDGSVKSVEFAEILWSPAPSKTAAI